MSPPPADPSKNAAYKRRLALKTISGSALAGALADKLPRVWQRPLVQTAVLPAHAQGSPGGGGGGSRRQRLPAGLPYPPMNLGFRVADLRTRTVYTAQTIEYVVYRNPITGQVTGVVFSQRRVVVQSPGGLVNALIPAAHAQAASTTGAPAEPALEVSEQIVRFDDDTSNRENSEITLTVDGASTRFPVQILRDPAFIVSIPATLPPGATHPPPAALQDVSILPNAPAPSPGDPYHTDPLDPIGIYPDTGFKTENPSTGAIEDLTPPAVTTDWVEDTPLPSRASVRFAAAELSVREGDTLALRIDKINGSDLIRFDLLQDTSDQNLDHLSHNEVGINVSAISGASVDTQGSGQNALIRIRDITIPANVRSVTIPIRPTRDQADPEPNESLVFAFEFLDPANIGEPASTVITIENRPAPLFNIWFEAGEYTVAEGDQVTVNIGHTAHTGNGPAVTVFVQNVRGGSTASLLDYQSIPPATLPPGAQQWRLAVPVAANSPAAGSGNNPITLTFEGSADTLSPENEEFVVLEFTADGLDADRFGIIDDSDNNRFARTTIKITNVEPPVTVVQFASATLSAAEGETAILRLDVTGGSSVMLDVVRAGNARDEDLDSVTATLPDSIRDLGAPYHFTDITLTAPHALGSDGESAYRIHVTLADDSITEGDETLTYEIRNLRALTPGHLVRIGDNSRVTLTIEDHPLDRPVFFGFAESAYPNAAEGQTTNVVIQRAANSGEAEVTISAISLQFSGIDNSDFAIDNLNALGIQADPGNGVQAAPAVLSGNQLTGVIIPQSQPSISIRLRWLRDEDQNNQALTLRLGAATTNRAGVRAQASGITNTRITILQAPPVTLPPLVVSVVGTAGERALTLVNRPATTTNDEALVTFIFDRAASINTTLTLLFADAGGNPRPISDFAFLDFRPIGATRGNPADPAGLGVLLQGGSTTAQLAISVQSTLTPTQLAFAPITFTLQAGDGYVVGATSDFTLDITPPPAITTAPLLPVIGWDVSSLTANSDTNAGGYVVTEPIGGAPGQNQHTTQSIRITRPQGAAVDVVFSITNLGGANSFASGLFHRGRDDDSDFAIDNDSSPHLLVTDYDTALTSGSTLDAIRTAAGNNSIYGIRSTSDGFALRVYRDRTHPEPAGEGAELTLIPQNDYAVNEAAKTLKVFFVSTDLPTVSWGSPTYEATEPEAGAHLNQPNTGYATITLSITRGSPGHSVNVDFDVTNGTNVTSAADHTDYADGADFAITNLGAVSGTANRYRIGGTATDFRLRIYRDLLTEGNEEVTLTLVNTGDYRITGNADARVTLVDTPPPVVITTPAPLQMISWDTAALTANPNGQGFIINEPAPGAADGTVFTDQTVNITRGDGSDADVVFEITDNNTTFAENGDFRHRSRSDDSDYAITDDGANRSLGASGRITTLSGGTAFSGLQANNQYVVLKNFSAFGVRVYRDNLREIQTESITFTLIAQSDYTIDPANNTLTFTIVDNPPAPTTTLEPLRYDYSGIIGEYFVEGHFTVAGGFSGDTITADYVSSGGGSYAANDTLSHEIKLYQGTDNTGNLLRTASAENVVQHAFTYTPGAATFSDTPNTRINATVLLRFRDSQNRAVGLSFAQTPRTGWRIWGDGLTETERGGLNSLGFPTGAAPGRVFYYNWSDENNAYTVNGEFRVPSTFNYLDTVDEGDVTYHTYTITRNSDSVLLHTVDVRTQTSGNSTANKFKYTIGQSGFVIDSSNDPVDFRSVGPSGSRIRFGYNRFGAPSVSAWKLEITGGTDSSVRISLQTNTDVNSAVISERDDFGVVIPFPVFTTPAPTTPAPTTTFARQTIGWTGDENGNLTINLAEPDAGDLSVDFVDHLISATRTGDGDPKIVIFTITDGGGLTSSDANIGHRGGGPGADILINHWRPDGGPSHNLEISGQTGSGKRLGENSQPENEYAFGAASSGFALRIFRDIATPEADEHLIFTLVPDADQYIVDPQRSQLRVNIVNSVPPPNRQFFYTWTSANRAYTVKGEFRVLGTHADEATVGPSDVTYHMYTITQNSSGNVIHTVDVTTQTGTGLGSTANTFQYIIGHTGFVIDTSSTNTPVDFRSVGPQDTRIRFGYNNFAGSTAWKLEITGGPSGNPHRLSRQENTDVRSAIVHEEDDAGMVLPFPRRFFYTWENSTQDYRVEGEFRVPDTFTDGDTVREGDVTYHTLMVYRDNTLDHTLDATTKRSGTTDVHDFEYEIGNAHFNRMNSEAGLDNAPFDVRIPSNGRDTRFSFNNFDGTFSWKWSDPGISTRTNTDFNSVVIREEDGGGNLIPFPPSSTPAPTTTMIQTIGWAGGDNGVLTIDLAEPDAADTSTDRVEHLILINRSEGVAKTVIFSIEDGGGITSAPGGNRHRDAGTGVDFAISHWRPGGGQRSHNLETGGVTGSGKILGIGSQPDGEYAFGAASDGFNLIIFRDIETPEEGEHIIFRLVEDANEYLIDPDRAELRVNIINSVPPAPRRFHYTWSDTNSNYTVNGEFRVFASHANGTTVDQGDAIYHMYTITRNSDSVVLHTVDVRTQTSGNSTANKFKYTIGQSGFVIDSSADPVDFRSVGPSGSRIRFGYNRFGAPSVSAWKLEITGGTDSSVRISRQDNTDVNSAVVHEEDSAGNLIPFPGTTPAG